MNWMQLRESKKNGVARFLDGGSTHGLRSGEGPHFGLLPWLPTRKVGPTTIVIVETRDLEGFLRAVRWIWC